MRKTLFALFFLISAPLFAQGNLEQKAQSGDAEAQYQLGVRYHKEKKYQEAVVWFEKAAKQGHARSQSNMGLYHSSILQPQDEKKAFYWFSQSAAQGYAQAQYQLATCYEKGVGCTKDEDLALEWYMKAANQGYSLAQDLVGYWIDNGTHLTENKEEAFDWYMKAAQQGDAEAQVHVAVHLEKGIGIRRNPTEAFHWISKAAEQGYPQAMAKLAQYYQEGTGCTKDLRQASEWNLKAEKAGDLYLQSKKADKDIQYLNGNLYYEIISPTEVRVASHDGHAHLTDARIPSSIKIKKNIYIVTAIAAEAFHSGIGNYTLKSATLPGTIETIGKSAFQGCSKLARISIPNTVYYIGDAAFKGCNSLKDVVAPRNLKVPSHTAEQLMFADCCNLLSINGHSTSSIEIPEWFKKEIKGTNSPLDLALNGKAVEPPLRPKDNPGDNPPPTTPTGSCPLDKNIPITNLNNSKTFAVIIGNEDYTHVGKVPFAKNDAEIFAQYCEKTLGLPKENIRKYMNITFGNMHMAMNDIKGIAEAYRGDLNVIFYYSGHGIPDNASKDAYLLPVDADGSQMEVCYSLNRLYSELGKLNARQVTVFMDACFSGSKRGKEMIIAAKGVAIKPRETDLEGNIVVFAAATNEQTAFPYEEMEHGMFTYFLLDKLNQSRGNATLGELQEYIHDNVYQKSQVINRKKQEPTVKASDLMTGKWQQLKLIE